MIRRWASLLMPVAICFLLVRASPQPEDATVLNWKNDDIAQTRSERERTAAILVQAAAGLRSTDPVKAAHFLNRAGSLQLRLNSSEVALRDYQSALNILKQNPDPLTKVETLNGLAAVYNQLNKCSESNKLIADALELSEQHSLIAGKAEALLRLSDCQNLKDHPAAAQTAEQSLQLWESLGDKRGIALAYDALIDVAITQNDINQATQRGESSLQLWRELGVLDRQAGALISLGFIEYRKGAWQNCISFLVEAQSLIDENDEPYLLGKINAGIAEAFLESGLPESGLIRARDSLKFFTKSEDARGIAAASWDIGKAFFLLGNYSEAFKAFDSALQQSETNDDLLLQAMCHDSMARTHVAVGNADAALIEFKTSLDQYERIGNVRGAARVRTLMGSIYEKQGRVDLARDHFENALAQFEKIQDRVDESATSYALGSLELRQNRLDTAENFLRHSLLETEDINRASTSSDLAAALAPSVYGRYQTYIECLMKRSREQNQGQDAFQASESAHGRSLAEMLRATETSLLTSLDPELAAKEKSLRQQLRVKEDSKIRLLAADYKKEDLDRLEQEVAQLSQEYKQVRESIRTKFPAFDQLTKPVAWALNRIQQEVVADDETLLLEYSLGSESSYAWIVTRDGFSSYQLPGEKQIEEIARRVYNLLLSRETKQSELDQATATLAQAILFPFAEHLDKHRIIVVADGSLNYIPFQILPTAPSNKQPLIASHEIVNAPSASVLGQLRQENERRRQPANLLAAFGDAAFPADFAELKNSTAEQIASAKPVDEEVWRHAVRDIELNGDKFDPSSLHRLLYAREELNSLRELGGAGSFVVTGFDATREKLQSIDLSKYAILHFATHGILDPRRPENSGLFLSMVDRQGKPQNGFLGLQDIYNLRAPVDLVVLSACRTGLGKDVRGEGLIGLTRGFMYAGASSVVASLWKVDDEATSELMRQFYANMLEKQMTPSAALREAQNAIRQRPEWSSPYYWAAFTIQGEFNKPIKQPGTSRWQIYMEVIAALLLATAGCWLYFRRRRSRVSVTLP